MWKRGTKLLDEWLVKEIGEIPFCLFFFVCNVQKRIWQEYAFFLGCSRDIYLSLNRGGVRCRRRRGPDEIPMSAGFEDMEQQQ